MINTIVIPIDQSKTLSKNIPDSKTSNNFHFLQQTHQYQHLHPSHSNFQDKDLIHQCPLHMTSIHRNHDPKNLKVNNIKRLSKFLGRSLMIFIIKGFRTIVFIFIVISTMFWLICRPAFFRCLSNSGTFTELRITSFIESTWSPVLIPLPITGYKCWGFLYCYLPAVEFDEHLKKAGGHISWNVVEIIKMKTIVWKPLMMKNIKRVWDLFKSISTSVGYLMPERLHWCCLAYVLGFRVWVFVMFYYIWLNFDVVLSRLLNTKSWFYIVCVYVCIYIYIYIYILNIWFLNTFCRYTQLNEQTVLFLLIQFSISHLFALSLNVKHFYLTHR